MTFFWQNRQLQANVSGSQVPDAEGPPYTERLRPPRYNREVSITALDPSNQRRYAPKFFPDWTKADHYDAAVEQLQRELDAQREWHASLKRSEQRYGSGTSVISGGFYEHWPESAKNEARRLARRTSAALNAAAFHYSASGKRTNFASWRAGQLGR